MSNSKARQVGPAALFLLEFGSPKSLKPVALERANQTNFFCCSNLLSSCFERRREFGRKMAKLSRWVSRFPLPRCRHPLLPSQICFSSFRNQSTH